MAGFKRGGFRGGGGAFKKGYSKKRAGSEEAGEDSAPRASKRSKEDDDEADSTPVVPELKTDEEGNKYCGLNTSGLRRVTVSNFKGKTFVSIREYYTTDGGSDAKPGKKGISLNIDQYNALLSSIPLIESALAEKDVEVVRPDYDADSTHITTTARDNSEAEDEEDDEGKAAAKLDDEDDEE